MLDRIDKACTYIKEQTALEPEWGLVLGSGLGSLAEEITDKTVLPYGEIPGFLESTVEGHQGRLIIGLLDGKRVLAMQGRFHYYEGYDLAEVTFPIRVMAALGVKKLILTNAAGGINRNFQPGDIMLLRDHINLLGNNPLRGRNIPGTRFPDMTEVYSNNLCRLMREAALAEKIPLKEGVYCAVAGPSYETPAEIRFLGLIGADAVGMSTVPEAIVARQCELEVAGLSCITNLAAGLSLNKLNHEEVMQNGLLAVAKMKTLIKGVVRRG